MSLRVLAPVLGCDVSERRGPGAYALPEVDVREGRSAEGRRHRFLAVDRMTRFACVEPRPMGTRAARATLLGSAVRALAYSIAPAPADDGVLRSTR